LETTRVLRWLAKHDQRLQKNYLEETQRFSKLEVQSSSRRASLDRLIQTARDARDTLASRRTARAEMLDSIMRAPKASRRLAKERSLARRELAATVLRLQPAAPQRAKFSNNRGTLPWPAAGKVSTRFGQRVELSFGTQTSHHGIDIRATSGEAARGIASGRVAYADWLAGYGQVVILDHGEDYHSIYAHLSKVHVEAGDMVTQGASVGTVGDTGSTRGTVLYLEIRQKGQPIDPIRWLRH